MCDNQNKETSSPSKTYIVECFPLNEANVVVGHVNDVKVIIKPSLVEHIYW